MTSDAQRIRFGELHGASELFVMPNPWDVGSARLLASLGFKALATTSAGLAWSLGRQDQSVGREALVRHVELLVGATSLPLNVDSERCYPDEPGGVAQTTAMLADAGAAGFSIEDYDPVTGRIDDVASAAERVAIAAEAAHRVSPSLVLTGRAENHIRGVDDLDDTIERLLAYRDAGADVLYAPGLLAINEIARVVDAVRAPVNVLARANGPSIAELAAVGVRRVSTGSALARYAYSALHSDARALLEDRGYPASAQRALASDVLQAVIADRP